MQKKKENSDLEIQSQCQFHGQILRTYQIEGAELIYDSTFLSKCNRLFFKTRLYFDKQDRNFECLEALRNVVFHVPFKPSRSFPLLVFISRSTINGSQQAQSKRESGEK